MNLVTLSGAGTPQLPFTNINELSDRDAGVYALYLLSRTEPDLTFDDLVSNPDAPHTMGGWWTDLKKGTSRAIRTTGRVIGKTTGSAVRLITDRKVVDGVLRYAKGAQDLTPMGRVKNMFGGLIKKFTGGGPPPGIERGRARNDVGPGRPKCKTGQRGQ